MVVCHNKNCRYNKSDFCKNESGLTVLNGFAQCKIWYADNGSPRPIPFYPVSESKVPATDNQASPQSNEGVK